MIRYKAKKDRNPIKAIREMRIECMGGRDSDQNLTKLIVEYELSYCSLLDFRFGNNPYWKEQTLRSNHK